jgi:aminopeptidase N
MYLSVKRAALLLCLFLVAGLSSNAQDPAVDVQHYDYTLTLNDSTNWIAGTAIVTVRFLRDTKSFRLDLVGHGNDGMGMTVFTIEEGKQEVKFQQDSAVVQLAIRARKGETRTYKLAYAGIPRDGLIISSNKFGNRTFFSDNWPDRAHNWIPCVDHPSDKAPVDFTVIAPDHYEVVANGLKMSEISLPDRQKRTHYREKVALPTKVMVIGVADFAIDHPGDVAGTPVYSYVFPENKFQGFRDYAKAVPILAFFNDKLGPYAYEKLANIQSKTIFGGMENAGAIFYAEHSVGLKRIEELLAHEIAHQWFGDAVTETDWRHLWLSEGFATYMTHLYMEDKYGEDTLKAGMLTDRKTVIGFAVGRKHAVVDTPVKGQYMQLLNANSYQKGAWALHMLRRKLTDPVFWRGIREYFTTYDGHNANTEDFRRVMEKVSGQDLQPFFKQWLHTGGMPVLDVTWKYEPVKGTLNIKVIQRQEPLFAFPLEYAIGDDKTIRQLDIKAKVTDVSIPVSADPGTVHIDPNVNLLAEIR